MDEFVTLDSISASVIFPNCGHLVYSNALPPKKDRDLQQDDDGSENAGKKSKFAFFQTSSCLFGPIQYVKCRRLLLELNS